MDMSRCGLLWPRDRRGSRVTATRWYFKKERLWGSDVVFGGVGRLVTGVRVSVGASVEAASGQRVGDVYGMCASLGAAVRVGAVVHVPRSMDSA